LYKVATGQLNEINDTRDYDDNENDDEKEKGGQMKKKN
jgi:hypothetical protein